MPQTIHRGIKSLIDEANAEIETVSATDAIKIAHNDDVVIVDIRDPREIERDGKIPVHSPAPAACWNSGSIREPLCQGRFFRGQEFIFHCAGGMLGPGGQDPQDMGAEAGRHLGGGFAAWRDGRRPGGEVEPKKPKGRWVAACCNLVIPGRAPARTRNLV